MKLSDRIALVTGAGSGIGRAIALCFAAEGARVIVNDLDLERARATLAALGTHPSAGRAIQADVADSGQVKRMFAEVERDFGALDILVNNAGIAEGAPGEMTTRAARSEARMQEILTG